MQPLDLEDGSVTPTQPTHGDLSTVDTPSQLRDSSLCQDAPMNASTPQPEPVDSHQNAHDRFLDLMRFERNAIIRAGAGTGKTYSLVSFIVRLLAGFEGEVTPGRICAITFTEKAAAELKWRIRTRIAALVTHPDRDPALNAISEALDVPLPGADHWQRIHRDLGSMVVSTFHGFCAQLLRQYPIEAEVEPGFRMENELVGQSILNDVIEEVLIDRLSQGEDGILRLLDILPLTSSEWRAGLGRLVANILRNLREDGYDIDQVSTFHDHVQHEAILAATRASLDELHEQKRVLVQVWNDVDINKLRRGSELDRTFADQLEDFIEHSDLLEQQVRSIQDDHLAESVDVLVRYARPISKGAARAGRLSWDQKALLAPLPTFRDDVIAELLVGLAHQLRDDFLDIVREVSAVFAQRKRSASVLDFSDLLLLTRQMLRRHPHVRHALKERFSALLVDEFQDTNRVQLDLVMLLGETEDHEQTFDDDDDDDVLERIIPAQRKLFLVGDPKQSIYNFRGADVSVFKRVERRLVDDLKIADLHFLQHNRRSLSDLVDFGNRWFKAVLGPSEEYMDDPDYVVRFSPGDRMSAAREDSSNAQAVVSLVPVPERSKPEVEAQAMAGWIREYVSGQINRPIYHNEGAGGSVLKEKPEYRDVAILLRRFTHLETFQRALELARVPYYVVKGKGFYGCTEISDLMLCLRIMLRPDDAIALVSALRSPLFMLSDNGLVWLQREALSTARRSLSASLVCEVAQRIPPAMSDTDKAAVLSFASLYQRLAPNAGRLGPRRTLEALISGTHFREKLAASMRGQQRIGNIEKLLDIASSYERVGSGHLPGFVRTLEWLIEEEPREAEEQVLEESANAVRIMTIHQSKGLEFPVVMIPEVHILRASSYHRDPIRYERDHGLALDLRIQTERGRESVRTRDYDDLKETATQRQDAEERRLAYVAATRARDHLYISGWGRAVSEQGWRVPIKKDNHLTALQDMIARGEPSILSQVHERTLGELRTWALPKPEDTADEHPTPSADTPRWANALSRVLDSSPPPAERPIIDIDDLTDFDRCPRRYFLWHVLGLDTSLHTSNQTDEIDLDMDSAYGRRSVMGRGELAHAVLARLSFVEFAEADEVSQKRMLRAHLHAHDHALSQRQQDDVVSTLFSWLSLSPDVPELIQAERENRLLREHPFILRVPRPAGGEVVLRGRLDAVVLPSDDDLTGQPKVFEYAFGHAPKRGLSPYRFRMRCMALASLELFSSLLDSWNVSMAFLRDHTTPAQSLQGERSDLMLFQYALPEQLHLLLQNQRTQRWPRIDASGKARAKVRCVSEGCSYAKYCFKK